MRAREIQERESRRGGEERGKFVVHVGYISWPMGQQIPLGGFSPLYSGKEVRVFGAILHCTSKCYSFTRGVTGVKYI